MDKKTLEKKYKEYRFCFIIIYILYFITLFLFCLIVWDMERDKNVNEEIEIIKVEDCSNLSLIETSLCLKDWIEPFYKYNETDDDLNQSIEEIMSRGGDCKDYTNLYSSYLNYYGFKTEKVRIFIKRDEKLRSVYHTFVIGYDNESYCKLDLLDVDCNTYKNE